MVNVYLKHFFDWFVDIPHFLRYEGKYPASSRAGSDYAMIGFRVSGFYNLDLQEGPQAIGNDQLPEDCVFLLNSHFKEPPQDRPIRIRYYDYWLNRKGYSLLRPKLIELIEKYKPLQRPNKTSENGPPITIETIDSDFEKFISKYENKKLLSKGKK